VHVRWNDVDLGIQEEDCNAHAQSVSRDRRLAGARSVGGKAVKDPEFGEQIKVLGTKPSAARARNSINSGAVLASSNPVRTVGSYWPYATTLFDHTRRAMPTTAPMSLTDEQVYAVTAYILNLNGVVPADAVMNAQTLPQVKMPNRDGFVDYSRK